MACLLLSWIAMAPLIHQVLWSLLCPMTSSLSAMQLTCMEITRHEEEPDWRRQSISKRQNFNLKVWKSCKLIIMWFHESVGDCDCAALVTRARVIYQKVTLLNNGAVVCKRNLVDIFYHMNRQVAARVTKLVLGILDPILRVGEVIGGQW